MYYNTFIVKSMSDFMTNNNSNSSIIQRFWKMLTIKQGLQNSSRKHWKKKKKLRKAFNKIPTFFSCYIVLLWNHTAPNLLLLSKNSTFYQSIIFSWTFWTQFSEFTLGQDSFFCQIIEFGSKCEFCHFCAILKAKSGFYAQKFKSTFLLQILDFCPSV